MKKSRLATLLILISFSFSFLINGCGTATQESVPAPTEVVSGSSTEHEAAIVFTFNIVDADGNETSTEINTTQSFLAGALADEGIISQDEASAGFVTTVNGIIADWDANQAWWCLTDETGEATTVGISECPLTEGCSYTFTYTVGQ